jgi:general secretion pathway protein N
LIQRRKGLIIVGALTLVAALIITLPARIAYRVISSPYLAMNGISGTVWSGSAREFSTNGVYLRKLEWQMRPFRLLTGKVVYIVSGSPASGFFDSEVTIALDGSLTLTNLRASMPLQMFEKAAGVPGLRGNVSLQLERLQLANGRAVSADGIIDVDNLVVPMVNRGSLGGYRAEFYTQNNGILASIEDADGVVDLAGTISLKPDKSYEFLGYVAPNSRTSESLQQRLRFLPQTDQPNQHELRLEGSY